MQAEPDGRLDLWAREHYKSTIITFGLTIQDLLNDPEQTICIFSHSRPNAKKFLVQIKREFEDNAALQDLYPDVLWKYPEKNAPKWSEDGGLVLKRKGNPKESTIEAWGLLDGQPTGPHFSKLIYDDVVVLETVGNSDIIKKLTTAWEHSTNLGTEDGVQRYIGTRYHMFDSYYTMIERGSVIPRIYACTKDGTENFVPENCVLSRPETLIKKRRDQGPYTFGAQMLINPTADTAQGFKQEWLRVWPAAVFHDLNIYIVVDAASGKKKDISGKAKDSDYTVFWVIGYGADGRFYICDCVRDRMNLTQRAATLIALHRHWNAVSETWGGVELEGAIKGVGYEQYGMQADIEHIKTVQAQQNYRFEITELGGQMPKVDRIKRLVPKFEQGMIYLPENGILRICDGQSTDLCKVFIREEYTPFPVCKHDDMLDALARILDEAMAIQKPRHVIKASPSWRDELGLGEERQDFMTA